MRNGECGIARRGRSRRDPHLYIPHSAFRTPHWSGSALRIPHSAFSRMPEDLADVYRTTYTALVRFLYRKVWSAERAEDLAQEAFARALVHRPENARGWRSEERRVGKECG